MDPSMFTNPPPTLRLSESCFSESRALVDIPSSWHWCKCSLLDSRLQLNSSVFVYCLSSPCWTFLVRLLYNIWRKGFHSSSPTSHAHSDENHIIRVSPTPIFNFLAQSSFDCKPRDPIPGTLELTLHSVLQTNKKPSSAFYMATDNTNRGFINNVTWIPPKVPTIMTVESVQPDLLYNPQIYGQQTNVQILKYMEVIDLVVKNSDSGGHPCQFSFFLPSVLNISYLS